MFHLNPVCLCHRRSTVFFFIYLSICQTVSTLDASPVSSVNLAAAHYLIRFSTTRWALLMSKLITITTDCFHNHYYIQMGVGGKPHSSHVIRIRCQLVCHLERLNELWGGKREIIWNYFRSPGGAMSCLISPVIYFLLYCGLQTRKSVITARQRPQIYWGEMP